MLKSLFNIAAILSLFATGGIAKAAQPNDWGTSFQQAATPIMQYIAWFNNYTLFFIIPIVIFVLFLLIYVCWRFRAKANPVASKNTHNTLIEVVWTVVPVLILVAIAIPSFDLLFKQYTPPAADLTVKATGYQWYWSYTYTDGDDEMEFSSVMLKNDELKEGDPRLLAVDNEMVVPVGKVVRVQVTAADVLHSFAVPSFGIKADAVPGRLNETWFQAEKEGIYYGQCSELCGKDHAFMPIAVRVVSEQEYASWLEALKVAGHFPKVAKNQ